MAAIRLLGLDAEEPSPFVSLWTMACAHVSTSSIGSAGSLAVSQTARPLRTAVALQRCVSARWQSASSQSVDCACTSEQSRVHDSRCDAKYSNQEEASSIDVHEA